MLVIAGMRRLETGKILAVMFANADCTVHIQSHTHTHTYTHTNTHTNTHTHTQTITHTHTITHTITHTHTHKHKHHHTHSHTLTRARTHTHTRHVVALLGRTHALLGFTGYSACHDEIRALADVPPALLAAYRVLHICLSVLYSIQAHTLTSHICKRMALSRSASCGQSKTRSPRPPPRIRRRLRYLEACQVDTAHQALQIQCT